MISLKSTVIIDLSVASYFTVQQTRLFKRYTETPELGDPELGETVDDLGCQVLYRSVYLCSSQFDEAIVFENTKHNVAELLCSVILPVFWQL